MTTNITARNAFAVLCVLLCLAGVSRAHSPKAPSASPTTIVGTWEAFQPELPRLFVLAIGGLDPQRVRLVEITGSESPVTIVFQATKVTLKPGGRLVVHAEEGGPKGSFVADLDIAGTAWGDGGVMLGSVSVRLRTDDARRGQSLQFVKSAEGFAKWLSRARAQAETLLGE
jgi:hypothetical protein